MNIIHDMLIACAALATLGALYLLPAWLPARRWLAPGPWPVTATAALLLSFVIQSACGLVWGRWMRTAPTGEGLWFLGFLATLSLVAVLWPRRVQCSQPAISGPESAILGIILVAGLGVRSVHPLQHFALGQSDAYTHLTMIRQVLAWGFISNESYPPGFTWIMSLPVITFGWDPYYLARFGGAFFGSALVLSVYALLRIGSGSAVSALLGSALVAWFPGLMLLIKTGVGTFANQIGLVVLPLVMLGYLLARVPETRGCGALWLMFGFMSLALAVPMLLLHACGVLLLVLLVDGPWTRAGLWRRGKLILLLLTVAVSLLVIHCTYMNTRQISVTAISMTSADQTLGSERGQPQSMTLFFTLDMLARDFFGIKRWGLHVPLFDAALLGMVALFLCVLVWGIRRQRPLAHLLGCWGGLACVQVATGWLQFTSYQREGWSLLIAVGVLGGAIAGELWSWRTGLRPLLMAGLAVSAVWTFIHPPAHPLLNSSAEEELIRTIRLLRNFPQWTTPSDLTMSALRDFLAQQLDPRQPVAVCSRSLIQPDVFRSVAGPNPRLVFCRVVGNHPIAQYLAQGGQFLVVLDKPEDLAHHDFGVFGSVSPGLRKNFIEQQQRRYVTNREMEDYVAGLSRDDWFVAKHTISPRLQVITLRRIAPTNQSHDAAIMMRPFLMRHCVTQTMEGRWYQQEVSYDGDLDTRVPPRAQQHRACLRLYNPNKRELSPGSSCACFV